MAIDNKKIEKISEKYLDLPQDVQEALFSTTTSSAIFEVGKKYGLAIDKMGELADETGLVMLGLTKPSEYIKNLERRLELPAIKAKEVAEDINQKVFSPIRESLKKIHGITTLKEPAQSVVEPLIKTPGELTQVPVKTIPQKIVMPPHPPEIKVGESAAAKESKIEIKPSLSGRIEAKQTPSYKIPQAIQDTTLTPSIREIEKAKKEVPDIFLKKIPFDYAQGKPEIIMPEKKEPTSENPKEAKSALEKELDGSQKIIPPRQSSYTNNDPYKEPLQ